MHFKGIFSKLSVFVLMFFLSRVHNSLAAPLDGDNLTPKTLLIVIGYESLLCDNCHKSIVEFCLGLQSAAIGLGNVSIFGLLNLPYSTNENNPQNKLLIVRKQLAGFLKANEIAFPIVIDPSKKPSIAMESGNAVLLLDPSIGLLKKWIFPLSDQEIDIILKHITRK